MSIILFILFLIVLSFFISAIIGAVRFFLDVRKYSGYKSELDNLKSKYEGKINYYEKLICYKSELGNLKVSDKVSDKLN